MLRRRVWLSVTLLTAAVALVATWFGCEDLPDSPDRTNPLDHGDLPAVVRALPLEEDLAAPLGLGSGYNAGTS
jgi:hypothetical protein